MDDFPPILPVSQLLKPHPQFNAALVDDIETFYCGGQKMSERKIKYLRARNADQNRAYLMSRFNSAYYNNYFGKHIDDIGANIVQTPPLIAVNDNSDERAKYWTGLNSNADGSADLKSVILHAILEMLKHTSGFLALEFPDMAIIPGSSIFDAKASGAYDGKIKSLRAESVEDWGCTGSALEWVRVHEMDYGRASITAFVTNEVHTWTFYSASGIAKYQATRPIKTSFSQSQWDDKATAKLSLRPNPLGICPVFPVAAKAGFNLGDRLLPVAQSLFNRECAREFAIDSGALNVPILKTENEAKQIILHEWNALNVGINGDFKFVCPPAEIFAALKSSCDDLRGQFQTVISALADQAVEQKQNPRQSAAAKGMDRKPKETLLSLYAEPPLDALQSIVRALTELRGEAWLEPRACGLDAFGPDIDDLIEETTDFLAIPDLPPTARTAAMRELIFARLPNLSQSDRLAIEKELTPTASALANVESLFDKIKGSA